MRLDRRVVGLTPVLGLVTALGASAQSPAASPAAPAHKMVAAEEVVWAAAPAALPAGAKLVVLAGNPGEAGPFTVRVQFPAGYRIAPHWHPTDENVTVISGTIGMGMGEKFETSALRELKAGGYVHMPATMRHFLLAKSAAVVQVHGTGPFTLNYVNPADDPRTAAPAKD